MTLQPEPRRSESADVATRITPEDLAALAAAYGRVARRADRLGVAGVVGGLAIGALLLTIARPLALPDSVAPWFFGLGWAIALGSTAVVWRWYRKAVARFDFRCAACDTRVLKPTWRRSEAARVRLAVVAGKCPSCGGNLCGSSDLP
jgi:hypothetical protein